MPTGEVFDEWLQKLSQRAKRVALAAALTGLLVIVVWLLP